MQGPLGILETLRRAVPEVSATVAAHRDKSRRALAGMVCDQFRLVDARGEKRLAGCMKALRVLHSEEQIALPPPQVKLPIAKPRLLGKPVPEAVDVPADVREIEDFEIVRVDSAQDRAIWNTLMDEEHPRGVTTFAGAQMRYLIKSAHGYLGAVGFSAAALYLKARDRWMAWSHEQRSGHLKRVVNLSRFLIRPSVRCKNLASFVLGRVFRRLSSDFMARYKYVPYVVETFVGPRYEGTCFKAAGFQYLGLTLGRGRHAPSGVGKHSRKKVFAYELDPAWRDRLGVPHVELRPRLEVGAGLASDSWAEQEFGGAELGHIRRTARLVKSAALVAKTMGKPVTTVPNRDLAAVRGYWRFIEKADRFGITPAKILAPHRQRTIERMRTQKTVLCVQDGTDISYSTRPQCDGLEVIGSNQTKAQARGVHLHATLALNDEGLPLGVLRCSYRKKEGQTTTHQWIDGLRDIDEAAQTLPRKTRVLSVMDREADAFEIFAAQRTLKRTDVLIRAKHDRNLGKNHDRLFKAMRRGPAAGVLELLVERLSLRAKSGRITHKGRPKRNARMEVRFRQVRLPATGGFAEDPVKVSAVHVREIAPPKGADRIEWFLLTTVEVTSLQEAEQILEYYTLRWRVEDTFRVLKTGCRVEKLRMQQAENLHRAITLHIVTSWRLMLMTLLGRVTANMDAEVIFTDAEMHMLRVYARNYDLPELKDLASGILLMAMMGGYMNRKHDPPPGHEIMWRGYASLQMRAIAYEELGAIYDLVERQPP